MIGTTLSPKAIGDFQSLLDVIKNAKKYSEAVDELKKLAEANAARLQAAEERERSALALTVKATEEMARVDKIRLDVAQDQALVDKARDEFRLEMDVERAKLEEKRAALEDQLQKAQDAQDKAYAAEKAANEARAEARRKAIDLVAEIDQAVQATREADAVKADYEAKIAALKAVLPT